MGAKKLKGKVTKLTTVSVNALFGEFRLKESKIVVRYASTYVNPAAAGGHRDLLDELKPMRECVQAKELRSLGALLQRDLNDARVAQELVPYLQGSFGFFPAILAVIMPRDYLTSEASQITYPAPRLEGNKTDYGGVWSVEFFTDQDDNKFPFGELSIVRSRAEVVILDGQHRGNAFRFLSGHFDPSGKIYEPFYDSVSPAEKLNADLPVTLIWFEATKDATTELNPKLISRQLFIDVNNSAKPVSLARRILLDDRVVTCIATQEVYEIAAAKGFEVDKFSLLHGAFDMQSELARGRRAIPVFCLTTPEIIEEVLLWASFGSNQYNSLESTEVLRLREQKNIDRFAHIFSMDPPSHVETEDEELTRYRFLNPREALSFRAQFNTFYRSVLVQFFNDLNLLRPHYLACTSLAKWIGEAGSTFQKTAWSQVFCGGEGLYWTFIGAKGDARESQKYQNYIQAIDEIEQKFKSLRKSEYGESKLTEAKVNLVYEAFTSKAFQVGFAMAVHFIVEDGIEQTWPDAAESLISKLNDYTHEQWGAVTCEFKTLLIKGSVDPRKWPAYRNLLVRMFDGESGRIFDGSNTKITPEWHAFRNQIEEYVERLDESAKKPTESMIRKPIGALHEKECEILERCGLGSDWVAADDFQNEGVEYAKSKIEDKFQATQ